MKKIKLTKSLVTSICSSVCLLGASAGIIFGISAGVFKIRYLPLDENSTSIRISSALNQSQNYESQKISSIWNMKEELRPTQQNITEEEWKKVRPQEVSVPMPKFNKSGGEIDWGPDWGSADEISEDQAKARWHYASMVVDGSTHSTLDRSFNQSLYNGIVDFIQNKDIPTTKLGAESTAEPELYKDNYTAASYKPAEDNNIGLANTYKAVAADTNQFRALGLAGFNHCSPLQILGKADLDDPVTGHVGTGRFTFNEEYQNLNNVNMLLIDGDCANNQNVGSALFRSDQPGFLTGVSTCMYFINNLHTYHIGYKDLSIGAYGGVPIPTVVIYMGGVQRGIEFFNKFVLKDGILSKDGVAVLADPSKMANYPDFRNLCENSRHQVEIQKFMAGEESKFGSAQDVLDALYTEYNVKMIKLGDFGTHFTGSFASGDAIGITKQYLNRGASAIIAVAGPQSLDSAQEIKNQHSKCIVIGVDSAMEDGQYQRPLGNMKFSDVTEAPDHSTPAQKDNIIKFSAVKDMTTVTRKFLNLCKNNQWFDVGIQETTEAGTFTIPDPQKAVCNVGYKTCGNIQNGLISISFDGWHPLVQALRHITWGVEASTLTFEQAWTNAATAYLAEASHSSLPVELKNINNIDTYAKTKADGTATIAYKYYSDIMAILGMVLNDSNNRLNFDKISICQDPANPGSYIVDTNPKHTVLDWLENNMYFSC